MIFHAFLIKYAEIAIKGKNRYMFEDALVHQMNIALSKIEGEFEVKKEQGRIYVFCPEQYDYEETVETLQRVFGYCKICNCCICCLAGTMRRNCGVACFVSHLDCFQCFGYGTDLI